MAKRLRLRDRLSSDGLWWKTKAEVSALAKSGSCGRVFQPGAGTKPPLLVGRNAAIEALIRLVDSLASGSARLPSMGAVIYGPRGTGKTALLDVAVAAADERKTVTKVELDGQRIDSRHSLMDGLLEGESRPVEKSRQSGSCIGGRWLPSWFQRKETRSLVGPPGTVGALQALAGDGGCVVLVDEAHMMDKHAGADLLASVQSARRQGTAVAVVLAGTPDVLEHIGAMGVSFFLSRGVSSSLTISCGPVGPEHALAGIAMPLEAASIEVHPGWRERIPDLTKGYPYFIQVLGEALAELLEDPAGGEGCERRDRAVLDAFDSRVADHYERIWSDLSRDNLTACAVQIGYLGDACADRCLPVPETALRMAIDSGVRHPGDALGRAPSYDEAKLRMSHYGLLWTPKVGGPLVIGIPSFFSFAAQKAEQAGPATLAAWREDRAKMLAAAGITAEE